MFKEVDAPLLGWEVYARKDQFYKETGVALVANATKQTALGTKATEDSAYPFSALHYCLENFLINAVAINAAIDDYVQLYGDSDQKAMAQQMQAGQTKCYEATSGCWLAGRTGRHRHRPQGQRGGHEKHPNQIRK